MAAELPLVMKRVIAELAAFGTIGAVCLASDIILFNLLAFGLGLPLLLAKGIGMVITGTMAYLGHRHVTFRHREGGGHGREIPVFVLVTLATVALSLLPIYVARQVAGTSVLWLNIANLTGIALGTIMRYVGYRTVVWSDAAETGSVASRSGQGLADEVVAGHHAGHLGVLDMDHELVRE